MAPLPSIEPSLEPEAMWYENVPPAQLGTGSLVITVLALLAVALALALWQDVPPSERRPDLTTPLERTAPPLSPSLAWLFGGGVVGLGTGMGLRRLGRAGGIAVTEPLVPRLPVFLRFDGRPVVIVGGGPTAAAKIPALLQAGADVTLIAPAVVPSIDRDRVRVIERRFVPSDLDGAWFVTAAATPEVNRQVREAAEARALWVNAVDDPANATAYLGGTITRGGVTVAFSTAGKAPALAGLLREAFDALVPDDIDAWVAHASDLSRRQRAEGVPIAARRPQLLDVLNDLYATRPTIPAAGVRR